MLEIIDPKKIGQRIRAIRKKLGLSMSAFAERIDNKAKSGTVSNWETGKNLPNNERLKRIAELDGISVDELLFGSLEDVIYSIMSDVAKLKRMNLSNKNLDNKEEELLAEIERSLFMAITFRQRMESEYYSNEIDFSSLSDTEKINLIKKRELEENETIQYLITASVRECQEKNISISDTISILECMKKAISNYAYRQEYNTEGLINFLHSELDHALLRATEYVYLPDENVDKKRESIDHDISEEAYSIIMDAMDKLDDLKEKL